MLTAKPWKTEAVVRLGLSVFVCFCAGGVVTALVQQAGSGHGAAKFYLASAMSLFCLGVCLTGLQKSWRPEEATSGGPADGFSFWFTLLLSFYGGIFIGMWAIQMAGKEAREVSPALMIAGLLSLQGMAIPLTWFFVRGHRTDWKEAFGFGNNWRQALLLGLLSGSALLTLSWALQWLSAEVLTFLTHSAPQEQVAVQILKAAEPPYKLVLGLLAIALAPAAEELLFRGILYPWLKQLGRPRLALWGTSVLFALMHTNAVSFVPLLVLAVALVLLYEYTNNLLAPICAHAVFNAVNFFALWLLQNQTLPSSN
jgi:membrane protease YdiL (CAAX protease family)